MPYADRSVRYKYAKVDEFKCPYCNSINYPNANMLGGHIRHCKLKNNINVAADNYVVGDNEYINPGLDLFQDEFIAAFEREGYMCVFRKL
jgi:hypothetical protein